MWVLSQYLILTIKAQHSVISNMGLHSISISTILSRYITMFFVKWEFCRSQNIGVLKQSVINYSLSENIHCITYPVNILKCFYSYAFLGTQHTLNAMANGRKLPECWCRLTSHKIRFFNPSSVLLILFVQFSKAYIWRRRSKIKANILLLCLVGREIQLIRMNKGNLWFIGVANIRSPRCEHFTNLHGKGKHEPHVDVVCGRSYETCHSSLGKVSNKNYLVYKQIYYTVRTVYRLRYFSEVSWAQKTANECETKVKYGVDRYAVVWTGFEGNHAIKLGIGRLQSIIPFCLTPEKITSKEIAQN